MTQEEHMLMVAMMSGLYRYCNTLLQILKSNGIATEGDLPAFSALAGSDIFHSKPVGGREDIRLFVEHYRQQAEELGLKPW